MVGKPIKPFRTRTYRTAAVSTAETEEAEEAAAGSSPPAETPPPPAPPVTPTKSIPVSEANEVVAAPEDDDRPVNPRVVEPIDRPKVTLTRQMVRAARLMVAPLLWLFLFGFCGGLGIAAYRWLTQLPPLPNCQTLFPLFASDGERLYCAEQAARSGDLDALRSGIELVKNWSPLHPAYAQTQRLFRDWSRSLLLAARSRADRDDLEGAIALAKELPTNSSFYKEAQKLIRVWQKDQRYASEIEATIQAALRRQDWKTAETQLQILLPLRATYWQQRHRRLRQQVITEQISYRRWQQVQSLSAKPTNNLATIGNMIDLLEQINPNSYVRPQADAAIQRLSNTLVAAIRDRLNQRDVNGAIAIAQRLPSSIPLPPEAEQVFWFSTARPLVANSPTTVPLSEQLLHRWLTQVHLQRIPSNHPLYLETQPLLERLQTQVQDINQLQLASVLASSQQRSLLEVAIQLAQEIPTSSAHRPIAQQLVFQWRKDLQRLEDRPYLVRAQQLAAPNTVKALKAAIIQARRIPRDRALYGEVQQTIAGWYRQIQILEDRPLFKQAQSLAQQGKLPQAIAVASKIRAGRVLHPAAQAAIQRWTRLVQLAEDRAILAQARALAKQGDWEGAIQTAAQIAPDRVLHDQAEDAINQWAVQRDAQRAAAKPEPASTENRPTDAAPEDPVERE